MDWDNPLYTELPEWAQKREIRNPVFVAPEIEEGGLTQSEYRDETSDSKRL